MALPRPQSHSSSSHLLLSLVPTPRLCSPVSTLHPYPPFRRRSPSRPCTPGPPPGPTPAHALLSAPVGPPCLPPSFPAPPTPPVAGRVRAVPTLPADRPGPHAVPLPSTGSAPPPLPLRVLHVCVVSCVLSDRGWGSIPQRLWRDGSPSWSVSGRCPPRRGLRVLALQVRSSRPAVPFIPSCPGPLAGRPAGTWRS